MITNSIEHIYNFLQISNQIATSGQPSAEHFPEIKESGYELIINLALPTTSNALANEAEIVESLGMKYIHIPVIWEKPTIEQLMEFFEILETNQDKKIFVHCAANKRVSAFIYLYRRLRAGINDEEAKLALTQVWVPNEIWQKFIKQVLEQFDF